MRAVLDKWMGGNGGLAFVRIDPANPVEYMLCCEGRRPIVMVLLAKREDWGLVYETARQKSIPHVLFETGRLWLLSTEKSAPRGTFVEL